MLNAFKKQNESPMRFQPKSRSATFIPVRSLQQILKNERNEQASRRSFSS